MSFQFTIVSLGAALFAASSLSAQTLQKLDMKTGQWEITRTSDMSGMPPIPPEVLSRLTPEQRAKMEAAMQARGARGPSTKVETRCITKEDLDKPLNLDRDRASCKNTIVTSSSSKQEIKIDCDEKGMKATGTVKVEASNSENVKITSQINAGDGSHNMNMNMTMLAKWVGPSCSQPSK